MGVYDDITPKGQVNTIVLGILALVTGSTLFGLFVDRVILRVKLKGNPEQRPRGWVLGMLVSSYLLLLPGLFHTLFGYRIACMNGLKVMTEKKENTIEFAQELTESGSRTGCFFVVGFAVVLPVVKLTLLIAGGLMRHSKHIEQRQWARRFVLFVQRISKWASPDMFAYILLMYLIRGMNHPPVLNGNMNLDLGFSCFSTFCVASTICSLGVRAPTAADLGLDDSQSEGFRMRPLTVLVIVSVLSIVFGVFLGFGVSEPCMALRLDMNLLFDSGEIDIELKPLIEMLGIQELAADDVSLWNATVKLFQWFRPDPEIDGDTYEANCLIAFLLMSVCVLLFTVLDMICLLTIAVYMQVTRQRPSRLIALAHFFRKMSMLDVCITGVFVIILAGRIYRESGVVVSFCRGLIWLLVAEVCHYIAYYLVLVATDRSPRQKVKEVDDDDDGYEEQADSEVTTMTSSDEENTG